MTRIIKDVRSFLCLLPVLLTTMACSIGSPLYASEIQEGTELGAQIKVRSTLPVVATIELTPTISFASVIVELTNAVGGARTACDMGALVATQNYSCEVTGSVADDDSGLVISVTGLKQAGRFEASNMSRRLFTVPNPQFDAVAVAKARKEAARRQPVTLKAQSKKPE